MKTRDKMINGFSKFSKREKIAWLAKHFLTSSPVDVMREFASFWHTNEEAQRLFDGISENTLTNFYMPFGVAPNFLINDRVYCVPMVIEESSVVAAASSGAKFWYSRGGFKAEVISTIKPGHVYFSWKGDPLKILGFFKQLKPRLLDGVKNLTSNMEKRGGGMIDVSMSYRNDIEENLYQLEAEFETCDAMGANFINTVLEGLGKILMEEAAEYEDFFGDERKVDIVMAILSNYAPKCLVRSGVECKIDDLGTFPNGISAKEFAEKLCRAVRIAQADAHRATTHNKGIFNGIDAVVIATGNDFRAVESCGHAYAARKGFYSALSEAVIEDDNFRFTIEVPLTLGTVGGLTKIHPLAKRSLELLGNPSATELMTIAASVGLAQNFAALRSLTTTGIQKGHMKMHLHNILTNLNANEKEKEAALVYFKNETISHSAVRQFLENHRKVNVVPVRKKILPDSLNFKFG